MGVVSTGAEVEDVLGRVKIIGDLAFLKPFAPPSPPL